MIDLTIGLWRIWYGQAMLLPIGCDTLFRLLTGYGHHPESRLLTMTEIIVVEFRQFTLTVFTCGMEKHDDRGSLHAVIAEYGTISTIYDLNGKGRQTIPYPDDARSVRISRIMVIVNNTAKQQPRYQNQFYQRLHTAKIVNFYKKMKKYARKLI